jgi:hypothetical protein
MHLLTMLMPPERKLQRIILKSFLHPIDIYASKPDLENDSDPKCLLAIVRQLGTKNVYLLRCLVASRNITVESVFRLASKQKIFNRLNHILACNFCFLGNTVKDGAKIRMNELMGLPVEDQEYKSLKKQLQRLNKKDIAEMTFQEFNHHKALYQNLRSDIRTKEMSMQIRGISISRIIRGLFIQDPTKNDEVPQKTGLGNNTLIDKIF